MKTKNFIMLIIGIVLAGAAIGAAFLGGEVLGKRSERAALTQQMQNRLGQYGGGASQQVIGQPGAGQQGGGQVFTRIPGGGNFGGGGATGTVQSVNGNNVTVTTQNGSTVSFIVSSNTTIEKRTQGTASDITSGSNIIVGGQRNVDGTIHATIIMLQ